MPAALAENGVFISQFSQMFGEQILLISKIGCRIEAKSHGYVIMAKPPDWNVIIFNPEKLIYAEMPLKKWEGPYLASMHKAYSTKFSYLVKTTSETDMIQKLPVTRIRYKMDNVTGNVKEYLAYRAFLSVTKDIPASDPLQKVIYQYYSIPLASGIPLEFDWMDRNYKWQKYVTTNKWWKGSCSQKNFELPPNAKKVKSSLDVVVSNLQDGMFETFFGSVKK
jgi:hypothetical protein